MIHAYDKLYLERARTALARMLDVGVNDYGLSLSDFYQLFLESTVAERFQEGDYEMLVGHSGAELAWKVLEASGGPFEYKTPQPALDRSGVLPVADCFDVLGDPERRSHRRRPGDVHAVPRNGYQPFL